VLCHWVHLSAVTWRCRELFTRGSPTSCVWVASRSGSSPSISPASRGGGRRGECQPPLAGWRTVRNSRADSPPPEAEGYYVALTGAPKLTESPSPSTCTSVPSSADSVTSRSAMRSKSSPSASIGTPSPSIVAGVNRIA
jgi:hypothetical protein